jgi:hypothetical protein
MGDPQITYHDAGPDDLGRRKFTLEWIDSTGRKRGQCFHADPAQFEAHREGEADGKVS